MYQHASQSSSGWTPEKIPECLEFLSVTLFAESFVDSIIEEAKDAIHSEWTYEAQRDSKLATIERKDSRFTFTYVDSAKPEFTSWPTIRDFTIELGASKIDEYLSSFPVEEEWLYAIYYLKTICENLSDLHVYEAKWSLPTASYPIAQSTASIFFTIEASRVLPKNCLVRVSYRLETHRFIHNTDLSVFNEKWLLYILDAKIKFFQNVKY